MKEITRKCIRLQLKRPLSAQEIWNRIMDVQIQALETLLEENNLENWRNIFPCFGTSLELVECMAKDYIELFQSLKGNEYNDNYDHLEKTLTLKLNPRWFNTIMSTLFMMEEDLLATSADGVFELWDMLFSCQALRKEDNVVAMRLVGFKLKNE